MKCNKPNKNSGGFTLIELLVVIAIIGLLSSVVLASLSSARIRARDSKRTQDAIQMRNALSLYELDNGGLPACPSTCTGTGLNELGKALTGNSSYTVSKSDQNNRFLSLLNRLAPTVYAQTSKYISQISKDPMNSGGYIYYYTTANTIAGSASYVDKNGITITAGLATHAVFYFQSETKSTSDIHTSGIIVGPSNGTYRISISSIIGGGTYGSYY